MKPKPPPTVTIPPFSTCVAIDFEHWPEFRLAQQTWKRWRPEIWQPQNPLLVFVDTAPHPRGESVGWWRRKIERCCDHPNMRVIGWPDVPGATQRHRMLSAFVYGVAAEVETPWILKLDTDCLAMKPPETGWWHPNWWRTKDPWAFVSCQWSYTKNIDMWRRLQAWFKTVPELADNGREVPGVIDPVKNHVHHFRIISFVFFARTEFIRKCTSYYAGPLMPIESQDTWLWSMAVKLGLPWAAVRMKKFSWWHGSRQMEKRVEELLRAA